MAIAELDSQYPQINTDPCNRRATMANWAEVRDLLKDDRAKLNEVVEVLNIINSEDIDITTIINNTTFITNVNNYINTYLNNYFSSLYATTIEFTLNADLAFDIPSQTWRAQCTVVRHWNGAEPPAGPIYVQDVGKVFRWKAPAGARGMAIQANDTGTLFNIANVETFAEIIQFRAKYAFATTAQGVETENITQLLLKEIDPLSVSPLPFGSEIFLGNLPSNDTGKYVFEGGIEDYGYAALVNKETKPADTISDPVYRIIQMECP